MQNPDHSRLTILLAVALTFGVTACANGSQADAEPGAEASAVEEAGEHAAAESGVEGADAASMADRSEAGGEHAESREGGEHAEGGEGGEHAEAGEGGEYAEGGEGGEHDEGGEEGEESGVYIASDATWDATRRGARLILAFDAAKNAFVGTVENTTSQTLCAVRVEIHLEGGTELGPTPSQDVAAGQSIAIELATGGQSFASWTAHPEMSACSN